MMTLPTSIFADHREVPCAMITVGISVSLNCISVTQFSYLKRATWSPTKSRRKVAFSAIIIKSVEDCPNELHQRGFTGLVRTIKQRHSIL